ncbi:MULTISPECIES: dihydrolipoyl dehydrogenase family protein [Bacillaceae]|uniref:Glutathione reductase (NADPH) n=1 Tax=Salimicrobium album TaxID=50717 RepID=A0A1H3E4A0_9BACI|nr:MULTISPECIES: NAD(P)/FAD-dependent oxidoreductase [Bacillaceae]SDX73553.1 glutathione reductase (NADPH) [Salimicrobium album]
MTNKYDLIVIGSGSGGSITAAKCLKEGWRVAMIDDRPYGGTCALRGCDPKKVLHGAAELYDWHKRMKGSGIHGDVTIDWPELMAFKKTFTDDVPDKKEKALNKKGMDTYHGKASFINDRQLRVEDEVLEGKYILIATGATPTPLSIPGEAYMTHSDEFLELDRLPETIVFVGGGYISFEFAHIAARAGAKVHIIHRGERPLKHFDSDLVASLLQKSEDLGIEVHEEYSVEAIEKENDSLVVRTRTKGKEISFSADMVVHGAGRVPALDLDLEQGNVDATKDGISVNSYLQSVTNPRVYAAGDAASTSGLPLTPVASMESHITASNILKGNHKEVEYPPMPSVVFTVPKLASVGMTETEAHASGRDIDVKHQTVDGWFTYKRTNETHTGFKILVDNDKDQVVGAHLISEEADELINHFATAIRFGIPPKEMKQMMYAYPTAASDIAHML